MQWLQQHGISSSIRSFHEFLMKRIEPKLRHGHARAYACIKYADTVVVALQRRTHSAPSSSFFSFVSPPSAKKKNGRENVIPFVQKQRAERKDNIKQNLVHDSRKLKQSQTLQNSVRQKYPLQKKLYPEFSSQCRVTLSVLLAINIVTNSTINCKEKVPSKLF